MCFVQSWHNSSKSVTPFSKSGMDSPFDLTSFPGFKSFGIKRDDRCDDDGAVFALQMSKKRSIGVPYDSMLAHLQEMAPNYCLLKRRKKSTTQAGIKALAEQKQSKEENPTVNWQDRTLLMTVGSGCSSNIRIGTIQDF